MQPKNTPTLDDNHNLRPQPVFFIIGATLYKKWLLMMDAIWDQDLLLVMGATLDHGLLLIFRHF